MMLTPSWCSESSLRIVSISCEATSSTLDAVSDSSPFSCFDSLLELEGSCEVPDSPAKDNSEESDCENECCGPFFNTGALISSKKDTGREVLVGDIRF